MPKYNTFLVDIYLAVPVEYPDQPIFSYRIVSTADTPEQAMWQFLREHKVGPEFTLCCDMMENPFIPACATEFN